MKIITTITRKLITAALLVVTGFNFTWATEPQEIIDFYAQHIKDRIINEKDLSEDQKTKIAGNVLAYKNCADQTIVLKSGKFFTEIINALEDNDDVIVVPLQDVVAIVGANQNIFNKYTLGEKGVSVEKNSNGKSIIFKPLRDEIKNYINLATKNTSEEWNKQFIQHQVSRLNLLDSNITLDNAKKAVLNDCQKNIQNLDQLRHTEFQINALLNAFFNPKSDEHKNLLNLLLPKNITLGKPLDKENSVYSLFEACNSCKLVTWLTVNNASNKNFFMFKVLDAQVLKYGKAVLATFHSQTAAENLQNAITVHVKNSNGMEIQGETTTMDLFNCNFTQIGNQLQSISSYGIACKHCANNTCTNHSDGFFIQWKTSKQTSLNKSQYQQHYKIEINDDISPLVQDIKTFISDVNKAAKTSSKKGAK